MGQLYVEAHKQKYSPWYVTVTKYLVKCHLQDKSLKRFIFQWNDMSTTDMLLRQAKFACHKHHTRVPFVE